MKTTENVLFAECTALKHNVLRWCENRLRGTVVLLQMKKKELDIGNDLFLCQTKAREKNNPTALFFYARK